MKNKIDNLVRDYVGISQSSIHIEEDCFTDEPTKVTGEFFPVQKEEIKRKLIDFDLTSKEVAFVNRIADKLNEPFEKVFLKLMHDGLSHLEKLIDLMDKY